MVVNQCHIRHDSRFSHLETVHTSIVDFVSIVVGTLVAFRVRAVGRVRENHHTITRSSTQ
jgi:hypothetical protein